MHVVRDPMPRWPATADDLRSIRLSTAPVGPIVSYGDGAISERNEIIFTDWDPTADGDLAALKNVFDSNQNGKLDAGDARWAAFRIIVTNTDGTTTLKTLAELGIQSINLVPDKNMNQVARNGRRVLNVLAGNRQLTSY